ncbi:MAG: hypothetical protein IIB78_02685 [Proteobacteria bacterium]|nr:hypothetical protein [Pseudomonadota bacterium]
MTIINVQQPSRMLAHGLIATSLLLTIGCSRPEGENASTEAAPPEPEVVQLVDNK